MYSGKPFYPELAKVGKSSLIRNTISHVLFVGNIPSQSENL
jgi:hypothetical protein